MNKYILIAIIIVVAGVLVALFWQFQAGPSGDLATGPDYVSPSLAPGDDSPEQINAELESVDLGDLDAEFRAVDSDINSL